MPPFTEFEFPGTNHRFGRSLTAPDSATYGVLPVIDPADGPFANAGAIFGSIASLAMLRPTVEMAPLFYKQGLLYEDQEGQDSSGTTGRNGLPI